MSPRSHLGASPRRAEDAGLVAGAHPYVADLRVPGCLEVAFVRSYEAHAHIVSVDVSGALEIPGVEGAWSAVELPDLPRVPVPPRVDAPAEMTRPSLASGRGRYVGEPVAVVAAVDRYAAEDGAERVWVEYDPLPAVLDPTEAAASEVRLFEGVSNVASVRERGEPCDDVFASAPVVVEASYRIERLAHTSIEARAILASPDPDGRLTVWCSHQAPHRLRDHLAATLGLEPRLVRVVVPKVGGAFGGKSQTYPEYLVVAHLALRLRRPVRWIEDRREALQAAVHGRGQNQRVRLAAERDGRILALDVEVDADIGAYPHTGEFVPSMTAWVISGPYRIPRLHVRTRSVVTNSAPTASYRGAGRPEAAYALERTVDKLARTVGMDPAEVRLRNFIPPEDFPYRSPTGAIYDSGDYATALRRALELAGYESLRAEQARRRREGGRPLGVGIASYVERSGGQAASTEYGAVEVRPDGRVEARTGATSQGQGHETAFAQVVASALDLDLGDVEVVAGDTDQVPRGTGTFGSRSMQVGGSALHRAALDVLEEARERATKALEVSVDELSYSGGVFRAPSGQSVDLGRLAADDPLVAEVELGPPQAFPFGTYVAVVELDPDTGDVTVLKLVAVDDVGVIVNPRLVHGQVVGSVVQGLGAALYEQVIYDPSGQPLVSSLMDYSLPTASEVPELVVGETITPNPNVLLGTKGAGEAGCIGTPPAVVNAVVDALDGRDDGIDLPVTPEKVWRVLAGREENHGR